MRDQLSANKVAFKKTYMVRGRRSSGIAHPRLWLTCRILKTSITKKRAQVSCSNLRVLSRQRTTNASLLIVALPSTYDTKSPQGSSAFNTPARHEGGHGNMKTTILYSPRTGRRAALVSGELPEASVKPKRGTPVRIACYFCRRRKIACGGPVGPGEDKTCK